MGPALRVLIVEDMPDDVDLIILALRRGGLDPTWERVETADGLRAALAAGQWDAVLSDHTLPELSAIVALEVVRGHDADLPFVVVSGTVGEEVATAIMRLGANDYVLKHNLVRLAPALDRERREADNRRARRAAERTAHQLAAIVDSSQDAIFSTDLDGHIEYWNLAAEVLFGYGAAEAVGRSAYMIVPLPLFAESCDRIERVRNGENVPPYETVRLRKNGALVPVSVSWSAVRVGDRVVGLACIYRDVSDRKRAEDAVRASEERFRSFMDHSPAAAFIKDEGGRYLYVNPTWRRQFDPEPTDWQGKTDYDFWPRETADAFRASDAACLTGNATVQVEETARAANGNEFTFLVMKFPLTGGARRVGGMAWDITDRKRAEEALRASESRLRAIIQTEPECLKVVSRGGRLLEMNPAGLAMLQVGSLAEAQGRSLVEFVAPEHRAAFRDLHRRVIGGENGRLEYEIVGANGTRLWLDTHATPLRDDAGRTRSLLAITRDITDQKRSETALRTSEQRYRTLVAASAAIVWNTPASGEFEAEQREWTAFTGQTFDQLRGWGWLNAIHADDRENTARVWTAAFTERLTYQVEHRLRRADGEYRHMSVRAVPLLEPDGAIREWVGVHTDVTDLKRAESALKLSEFSVQKASLPTLWIAPDARIIRANRATCELLGYTEAELLTLAIIDLDPDFPAERWPLHWRELRERKRMCFVTRQKHKSGHFVPVEVDLNWFEFEGREYNFAFVRDLTERLRLEEQFRQAQRMEAVGLLAGGVAHDFNNLLTIINGYSDLLLQTLSSGDPSRELVTEILKAGERSAGLTRQLLAFSRQQVLAPRVLDLNEVVADTDKMLRRLIGEDVQLTTTLATKLRAVRADPGQIEQVLMNLAVNARDAMPQGGRLTIETQNVDLDEAYARTHPDAQPGRHVLLSMTDTGSGMSAAVKARIFDPFFTTKGLGKGTGLGLATVYGIIKQSGGHVAVYSEVGVGTTFKVYLPRVDRPVGGSSVAIKLTAPGGTETILLAEDESAVRDLIRRVLVDYGYTVVEASDGADALRALETHAGPIHLLVTDVVMPGMSGRAVAERVPQFHPGVPVLFVSGYTDDAVIRHGVLREGVNFLQKPFSPLALALKVREVLDARAAAGPL